MRCVLLFPLNSRQHNGLVGQACACHGGTSWDVCGAESLSNGVCCCLVIDVKNDNYVMFINTRQVFLRLENN